MCNPPFHRNAPSAEAGNQRHMAKSDMTSGTTDGGAFVEGPCHASDQVPGRCHELTISSDGLGTSPVTWGGPSLDGPLQDEGSSRGVDDHELNATSPQNLISDIPSKDVLVDSTAVASPENARLVGASPAVAPAAVSEAVAAAAEVVAAVVEAAAPPTFSQKRNKLALEAMSDNPSAPGCSSGDRPDVVSDKGFRRKRKYFTRNLKGCIFHVSLRCAMKASSYFNERQVSST